MSCWTYEEVELSSRRIIELMKQGKPPRKPDRSAHLFVVAPEPPPPTKLIEWPEDEAEAAAITAQCRVIGKQYRALLAAGHDVARWDEAGTKMLRATLEYLKVHPDAISKVGGRCVYSEGYRRFLIALARGPGEGMTLAELAWFTDIPAKILNEWLEENP